MPAGVLIGITIALVLSLTSAALLAYLILSEKLPYSAMGYGSKLILALAALFGCKAAGAMCEGKSTVASAVAALGFFLSLLGIHWLFFDGQFAGILSTAAAIGAGGGIASIPTLKGKKSGGKRRKISAYR